MENTLASFEESRSAASRDPLGLAKALGQLFGSGGFGVWGITWTGRASVSAVEMGSADGRCRRTCACL